MKRFIKNFLHNRNKKASLSDFHNSSYVELQNTSFNQIIFDLPRIIWTPNISLVQPSLEFMEFLEDCHYQKNYDIYHEDSDQKSINDFVENFIYEAFSEEEKDNLIIEKNAIFEINEFSPFWGNIDFVLKNKNSDEFNLILVSKKTKEFDVYEGFYKLNTISALTVIDYFIKSHLGIKKVNVVLTNGHQWQMYEYFNKKIRRTKTILSKNKIINFDLDIVKTALGLIRYGSMRYENEILLDQLLLSYDENKFLTK